MTEYSNENTDYKPISIKSELPASATSDSTDRHKCKCEEKHCMCEFLKKHARYITFEVYTPEDAKEAIELFRGYGMEMEYDINMRKYDFTITDLQERNIREKQS